MTTTWAAVTQLSPLRVRLDGDAAALVVTPDTLIDPAILTVGQRVRVELANNRLTVLGVSGGARRLLSDFAVIALGTEDLDTILASGLYRQITSANATTGRHYPVLLGGLLTVEDGRAPSGESYATQTYATRDDASSALAHRVFIRNYRNGAWNDWRELAQRGYDGIPFAQAAGKLAVTSIASTASADFTLTFPSGRFTVAPNVFLTSYGTRLNWQVTDGSVTTSGCTIRVSNWTTGAQAATFVGWLAVQMLEGAASG